MTQHSSSLTSCTYVDRILDPNVYPEVEIDEGPQRPSIWKGYSSSRRKKIGSGGNVSLLMTFHSILLVSGTEREVGREKGHSPVL